MDCCRGERGLSKRSSPWCQNECSTHREAADPFGVEGSDNSVAVVPLVDGRDESQRDVRWLWDLERAQSSTLGVRK